MTGGWMNTDRLTSEDMTVGAMLAGFYRVPRYQREYVWGEGNVQRLLDDIFDLYDATGGDSEYFIGSIVTQQDEDEQFDLIDGQQRITTLFVVLCAVRDRIRVLLAEVPPDLEAQIYSAYTNADTAETEYRFRVTLQYSDGQHLLESLGKMVTEDELHRIPRTTRSASNILDAYELSNSWFCEHFKEDAVALKRFWLYLTRKVKLIRVKTGTLSDALRVFETINDRGVGLDAMDLLKNLLFIQASPAQYDSLRDKWETLARRLYSCEKPLRFLRYYLISDHAAQDLQANRVYEWINKQENAVVLGYRTDPLGFVDRLLEASEAYAAFTEGKTTSGALNQNLVSLRILAGSARQQLILLLAGRHLSSDAFDRLCKAVEDLFFIFIVTRTPKNVFETSFAKWAPMLRRVKSTDELEAFLVENVAPMKAQLAPVFDLSLRRLGEISLPKYRRKYLLAKIAQHINMQAYPGGVWDSLQTLMDRSYEVEHVLPLVPRADTIDAFDRPEQIEEFKHRLGNLTLVEKPINASIANAAFSAKRVEYAKSNLLLTASIAGNSLVGSNTTINAAQRRLTHFDTWDSNSIEKREFMLLQLAHEVWGLPEIEGTLELAEVVLE